jgi:hypothetical protein
MSAFAIGWWPGKFVPKSASKTEDALILWAPPQLLGAFVFGLFIPGFLGEYALFSGYKLVGMTVLLLWGPILWLFLIELHDMGRVRFWLSAPLVLGAHVLMGLWLGSLVS